MSIICSTVFVLTRNKGMFRSLNNRLGHYLLLVAVAALLILPNLGRPSLWDIDEGNNAEAAREMMESEDWVVPKFNYQLRVDKPALLYWLQIGAYRLFGINELAARFPSALAALLTVLLAYELARGIPLACYSTAGGNDPRRFGRLLRVCAFCQS